MSVFIQSIREMNFSFDKWIMFSIIVLLASGLIMNLMATSNRLDTGSSSQSLTVIKYKVDIYAKFRGHMIKIVIGLLFAFGCYMMPLEAWRKAHIPAILIGISLVLFLLVYLFGEEVNGARRWLRFFGMQLSPSDVARFALIVWLADFLTAKRSQLHNPINLLKASGVVAAIAIPIIQQPNLSTVMIIAAIAGSMLWVSGIPRKWVYTAIVLVGVFGAVYVAGTSFRNARSKVFMDPFAATLNYDQNAAINLSAANAMRETSYQQRQSIIAMVMGGIDGVGYGTGKQKYFLPEAFNDCIIAIIGEEWGLIGVGFVVLLFVILTWRGFRTTVYAPDHFQYLLAFGVIMNFLTYFFIHFFVNVSAMPSTGVPLPFISHGGTAMVFNLGLAAILLRISTEAKCPLYPK